MRLGEGQALGFLAAERSGKVTSGALELSLESAAIAHEVGWAWWEAASSKAATFERERGISTRRGSALRSL